MKIEKFSQLLALVAWASVFVEGWLILLRTIPADGLTWFFFGLFFVVAVMAGAVASPKRANISRMTITKGEYPLITSTGVKYE